jgi:SAM-dependent methyltransferase
MLLTNVRAIETMFPWFKNWFDSAYYHKLYSNRDEKEAAAFIDHLAARLPAAASVIDVGCGTGRHSRHLAEKGFTITGIDLSSYSLQLARQYKNDNLQFYRHDMRLPFGKNRFDVVLNLFTSFGYFATKNENLQVIENIYHTLKPGGTLVIDYLNMHYTQNHLVVQEQKEIDGIIYNINRWTDEQFFYKHIAVEHESLQELLEYTEQVSKFGLAHFKAMLAQYNLEIINVYGDYGLNDFDEEHSKRLIIVAKKN